MGTRIIFLLIFLIGLDAYSYQWLRQINSSFSPGWKIFCSVFFWLGSSITLFLLIFSLAGLSTKLPGSVLTYLRAFAFITYFAKFVSLPILLIDDIRRSAGHWIKMISPTYEFNPSRSKFLSTIGAFIAGIPFLTLFYGMARNAYRYQIRRIKVPVKNLPSEFEGLRIVQISDIHSGSFTATSPILKSIAMVKSLNPDLLFFTGDLVNFAATEVIPYKEIFAQMKGKYGSYSIFGNHDYGDYFQWESAEKKHQNLEDLKTHHADIGWKLMLNQHDVITINGKNLCVIGVENFSASRRFSKYGSLAKAYEGTPDDTIKLLLSHDPSHWHYEVTKSYKDIALTLSGHTHGFQFGIEIPGYFRWSPSQYVYKEWAGLYKEGDQHLYVNRGFGFLAYPGRVGILPEITLLELTSA
ncbi:MAG: metallophosphoesterase [Saprospiraceae bacterium]